MKGREDRRRHDAEVNRDILLDAALAALLADPDAGLDAVASAAHLSRRTVYGHFASRRQLIAAVADRAGERVADVVRVVRETTPESEHPLATLARLEVRLWRANERYRLLGSLASKPEHGALVAQHMDGVRALRLELVEAGRGLGTLPEVVPVEVVARLLEMVHLTVFDAVLGGRVDAEEAARIAALTALAVVGTDPWEAEVHAQAALCVELPA